MVEATIYPSGYISSINELIRGISISHNSLLTAIPRIFKLRSLKDALFSGPLVEAAKKSRLPYSDFPKASIINDSGGRTLTCFYERNPGMNDIFDAEKKVKQFKEKNSGYLSIIAYNVSDSYLRDFVGAGANVNCIIENPSYSRTFDLLMDNINITAVFDKNTSYSKIKDIKDAERDTGKRGSSARAFAYVFSRNSLGQEDDVRMAGGMILNSFDSYQGNSPISYYLRRR